MKFAQNGVTVLGASGFIGTRLIDRLVHAGAGPIVAVDIAPPRARLPGVSYVQADVRTDLDPGLCREGSALVNLAAVHRTPGHPPQEYYETNVLGALSARKLAMAAGVRTIIFTSSISVYGPSESALDETSPPRPVSDYGRSKFMAECIHRTWSDDAPDRRLVIVRPAVVFGPGERGNYTRLAHALRRGYFAYPGRKDTVKSGGYVDELIRTFDFAVERGQRNTLYNFAFPGMASTEDIVSTFSLVTGKRYTPPMIPLGPLMIASRAAQLLGKTSPLHPERVMKLVQSTRILPAWLLTAGYEFEFGLKSALQAWSDQTRGEFD